MSVAAGSTFEITGFSFVSNRSVSSSTPLRYGPKSYVVRTSDDGFSSDLFGGDNLDGVTGTGASCGAHSSGALSFVVPGGTTFSFRVYAYHRTFPGESATSITTFRIDDVVINGVLPIELEKFEVQEVADGVKLSWETATEVNNDYFEIERSIDGVSFESLQQINGAGESNIPIGYSWVDEQPFSGPNYYRLKQVDFDGRFSYSEIKVLQLNRLGLSGKSSYLIQPNPAFEQLTLRSGQLGLGQSTVRYEIYDLFGRVVEAGMWNKDAEEVSIDLSTFSRGSYWLRIFDLKSRPLASHKFMKI